MPLLILLERLYIWWAIRRSGNKDDIKILTTRACRDCAGSGLSGSYYVDGSPHECRPCRGNGYVEYNG